MKLIKRILFGVILTTMFFSLQAQNTLKIGHVNIQDLVEKHPFMDSIKIVLDQESKDMETIYNEMLAEYEKKMKTFEEESANYSDFVKQTKQKELMDLAQKIQDYNQSAKQQMQRRNIDLLRPVYDNINQELTNIAGQNNFSYILDISKGMVAYISPESENITQMIMDKIGYKKAQKENN